MVKIERLEEFQAQGDKCVALLYEKITTHHYYTQVGKNNFYSSKTLKNQMLEVL